MTGNTIVNISYYFTRDKFDGIFKSFLSLHSPNTHLKSVNTQLLQIRVYILIVLLPGFGWLKDEQNPYYTYILTNNS